MKGKFRKIEENDSIEGLRLTAGKGRGGTPTKEGIRLCLALCNPDFPAKWANHILSKSRDFVGEDHSSIVPTVAHSI